MKFPKTQYVRSKKLLKLVAGLDCQWCGSGQQVQAAHSNWGGGKGRGIKASDNEIAALCFWCHYQIDQGKELSKEERKNRWEQAHLKTLQSLATAGLWPEEIPFTDQYLRILGNGASFCEPPCG